MDDPIAVYEEQGQRLMTNLMIPDVDIWRSANELIKHCDTADIEAAARADDFQAKGDLDGQRVWLRITKAIDTLQKVQPGENKQ